MTTTGEETTTKEKIAAPKLRRKKDKVGWWPPPLGGRRIVETKNLEGFAADPKSQEQMEFLSKWFDDEELGKWMDGGEDSFFEREDAEVGAEKGKKRWEELGESFEKEYSKDGSPFGDIYIFFRDRATGKPVGFSAVYGWEPHIGRAEISMMVGEDEFRGRGLGKEVVSGACEIAFAAMGAMSLTASVVVENVPSKRALERNGFRPIGVRHRAHRLKGMLFDEFLMECLPEWFSAARDPSTVCFLKP